MKLITQLSNKGALRCWQTPQNGSIEIDVDVDDLPSDVRSGIADRLHDDQFVCKGEVNAEGSVDPSTLWDDQPDLLTLDGDDVDDLINAVREDMEGLQEELEEHRKHLANKKAKVSSAA
jgi:hypothetical protein